MGWEGVFVLNALAGLAWMLLWCAVVHDTPARHPRLVAAAATPGAWPRARVALTAGARVRPWGMVHAVCALRAPGCLTLAA